MARISPPWKTSSGNLRPDVIAKLVERIARRPLAMLREEMSEEPRLDALDRLRIGVHQQQIF